MPKNYKRLNKFVFDLTACKNVLSDSTKLRRDMAEAIAEQDWIATQLTNIVTTFASLYIAHPEKPINKPGT